MNVQWRAVSRGDTNGSLCTVIWITITALTWLALAPIAASAQPPSPTIAITSPSERETVKGTVEIEARAVAGPGDQPVSITFYDGVNEIQTVQCEGQETCTRSVEWKATGLSGQHTLTARVDTAEDLSHTSAPVNVTVVSPPPTTTITAPSAGSTVQGDVVVSASSETDPSQEEYPTDVRVYDGINEIGAFECQGQRTCGGSVTWHATGLSGPHLLTAKVYTSRDQSATSQGVGVNVVTPPPSVAITSPATDAPLGGELLVSVTGLTDPNLDDYPTSLQVFDGVKEIGEIECQGQQTCAGSFRWNTHGLKGPQTLAAVVHTNRGATATSAHVIIGVAPKHRLSGVSASCQLGTAHLQDGAIDHGKCVIRGAPVLTHVAIQYLNRHHRWITVLRGHIHIGGVFHFKIEGSGHAAFHLTLLVGASPASTPARFPVGTVYVG